MAASGTHKRLVRASAEALSKLSLSGDDWALLSLLDVPTGVEELESLSAVGPEAFHRQLDDLIARGAVRIELVVSARVSRDTLPNGVPTVASTAPQAADTALDIDSLISGLSEPPKAPLASDVKRTQRPLVDPLAVHQAVTMPPPEAVPRGAQPISLSERPVARDSGAPALDNEERAELAARFFRLEDANYYELLDLQPGATRQAIRDAYFRLSKRFHPDRAGRGHTQLKTQMGAIFAKLTEAYDTLSRSARRQAYDAQHAFPAPSPASAEPASSRPAASGSASSRPVSVQPSSSVRPAVRSRSGGRATRPSDPDEVRRLAAARLARSLGIPSPAKTQPPSPSAEELRRSLVGAARARHASRQLSVDERAREAEAMLEAGDQRGAYARYERLAYEYPAEARFQEALKRLAPQVKRQRLNSLRARANSLVQVDDRESALCWFELAELEPTQISHLRQVVAVAEQFNSLAPKAKRTAESFVAANPDNAEGLRLLARVLLRVGLKRNARKVLEQALALDPKDKDTKHLLKVAMS